MESAMNIAKYIVTKCMNDEIPINNTQLQKILYIVQITFLKELGKPLFAENFEAWRLGPVIPDVYYSFCGWGVMKMCARGADTEDLMALKSDKNKVLRVGVDKIWGAPEDGTAERENDETCL